MKTSHLKRTILTGLATLAGALGLHAANLTWDADAITTSGAQDGSGNWTSLASNTNWWDGAANVTWNNATPDNATFGAGVGAAGTVTVPSSTTNTVGNLTFNATGSGIYTIAAGSSTTSKLNLSGTPTITVASGVSATNSVVFSGTSFTKLGAGTLVLRAGAPNINSGPTVVGAGTLIIGASAGRLVIPGDLTITNGATVQLLQSEVIADSGILTVNGGTFDTGGKAETIGGFIFDNNAQSPSSSSSTGLTNNGVAYDLRSGSLAPNLGGTAGLTKTTGGTVTLVNGGGANSFAGPVLVSAGILQLNHSGTGNGVPAVVTTITNTGAIQLLHDTEFNTNGTIIVAGGTFELLAHNDFIAMLILDNSGQILNGGNASKTLTVNTNLDFRSGLCASRLAGAGLLVKSTVGTVILSMDNANSGGALISAGILQLGDGSSTNRGQLGTGPVTNNAAIVLNHSSTFTLANNISGSGSLTNLGGTATATGTNTYTGATFISGGTLFANNTNFSSTGSGAVTVAAGATLGGNGIVGGSVNVQASATLAPGTTGLGTLTISNTLTLGGNTSIEINKGVGQDLIVANSVNYGGTLTVTDLGLNLIAGDNFQIFNTSSHTSNFTSIVGSPGASLSWNFNPLTGVLSVVSAGGTPPTLNISQSGSTLTFTWTDAAYKLQSQTNSLTTGLGPNWSDYPGGGTSGVGVTINPANPAVFFRLSQ